MLLILGMWLGSCSQSGTCAYYLSLDASRYDGRGHLFDLSLYDGANLTDADRELSEDNKQIEAYCDEERYLELHTDASKQAIYEGTTGSEMS